MRTLLSFPVQSGMVTEEYEILEDGGQIFLRCVLDAEEGAPSDMMQIDLAALGRIGAKLVELDRRLVRVPAKPTADIVTLPTRIVVLALATDGRVDFEPVREGA